MTVLWYRRRHSSGVQGVREALHAAHGMKTFAPTKPSPDSLTVSSRTSYSGPS